MTLYQVKDDLEAGIEPKGTRPYLRNRLPSTVVVHSNRHNEKGYVMLPKAWMEYVKKINPGKAFQYMFEKNGIDLHKAVGWHNTGKGNRVEQLTFSGNIVEVYKIVGSRAFVNCFHVDQKPPSEVYLPTKEDLHHIVHLLSTQHWNKLDITTNGINPRTFLIAKKGEELWIDIRDLKPYFNQPVVLDVPVELDDTVDPDPVEEEEWEIPEVEPGTCGKCGAPLICPVCSVSVETPEPETQDPEPPTGEIVLGVDVAYCDDGPIDYNLLRENGVKVLIAKIGQKFWKDALLDKHIRGALDAGLRVWGYWWVDPQYDYKKQLAILLEAIKPYPQLEMIYLDVEQYEGWGLTWNKKKTKKIEAFIKFSSAEINYNAKMMARELDGKGFPVGVYTRTSFILERCPLLLEWIKDYPLWLAQYPDDHVYTCDAYVAKKEGFTYVATWQEYMEKYAPKPDWSVWLPKDQPWDVWQFTGDRVKLPGTGSYIDLNYVRT